MKSTRVVIFMWLAWVLILLGFQAWVTARLELKFPDRARDWTARSTARDTSRVMSISSSLS